jgi:hypothetical protein
MDRPKKITPEISNYIETFSLLYSTLTNEVTATSVNQNFAAEHLSPQSVPNASGSVSSGDRDRSTIPVFIIS